MKSDTATGLMTCAEARAAGENDKGIARLLSWIESFPMQGHPDLGRTGVVCPFTKTAGKYGTLRLRTSNCDPNDEEHAFRLLLDGYADLDRIPTAPGMQKYRAIVIGFPNCAGAEGVEMIKRVKKRHKYRAVARLRMLGLMHPGAAAPGIWNQDFRPMEAPMPVLIVRYFVEQDSLFVAYQRLQWTPYLLLFGVDGARRLLAERRGN